MSVLLFLYIDFKVVAASSTDFTKNLGRGVFEAVDSIFLGLKYVRASSCLKIVTFTFGV